MAKVLFLAHQMVTGYGVSLVIDRLAVELAALGVEGIVGCVRFDGAQGNYEVVILPESAQEVGAFARKRGVSHVVAVTSPFFEIVPELSKDFDCRALECGDPSPSFFTQDREKRESVKQNKWVHCYPAARGVIGISKFIAQDIGWPKSEILYLGCDHAPDLGSKNLQDINWSSKAPLRVGTLMRMGEGEAKYKGNQIFLDLCERLRTNGVLIQPYVMGKGFPEDARPFEARGIKVILNASHEKKWEYLRRLDVFVSCSQWEGFNLPLVEAQALGTLSVAFDIGAHPEVTPFIVSDTGEMVAFLKELAGDRNLLLSHSKTSYRFVRKRFNWSEVARTFAQQLGLRDFGLVVRRRRFSLSPRDGRFEKIHRFIAAVQREGILQALRKTLSFLWHKLRSRS